MSSDTPMSAAAQKLVFAAFDRWSELGDIHRLSERERTFVLVWSMLGIVENGGLAGFFDTSTAPYAKENIQALKTIGAANLAAVLHDANAVFDEYDASWQPHVDRPPLDDLPRMQTLQQAFNTASAGIWEQLDRYAIAPAP